MAGELNVAVRISFYRICFSHAGSGTFRLGEGTIPYQAMQNFDGLAILPAKRNV